MAPEFIIIYNVYIAQLLNKKQVFIYFYV